MILANHGLRIHVCCCVTKRFQATLAALDSDWVNQVETKVSQERRAERRTKGSGIVRSELGFQAIVSCNRSTVELRGWQLYNITVPARHQSKNGREVSRSRQAILAPSVESIMFFKKSYKAEA